MNCKMIRSILLLFAVMFVLQPAQAYAQFTTLISPSHMDQPGVTTVVLDGAHNCTMTFDTSGFGGPPLASWDTHDAPPTAILSLANCNYVGSCPADKRREQDRQSRRGDTRARVLRQRKPLRRCHVA